MYKTRLELSLCWRNFNFVIDGRFEHTEAVLTVFLIVWDSSLRLSIHCTINHGTLFTVVCITSKSIVPFVSVSVSFWVCVVNKAVLVANLVQFKGHVTLTHHLFLSYFMLQVVQFFGRNNLILRETNWNIPKHFTGDIAPWRNLTSY